MALKIIWLVEQMTNPHRYSNGHTSIIVAYDDQAAAENFLAIHPQYHYVSGQEDPSTILMIRMVELGKVSEYWNPSFP